MNIRRFLLTLTSVLALFAFVACDNINVTTNQNSGTENGTSSGGTQNGSGTGNESSGNQNLVPPSSTQYEGTDAEVVYPLLSESRKESLDFIYSTKAVADINITITQEQWNKLLSDYDQNPKNEECVHADFKMEKAGVEWKIDDIGFRLRGNTSRVRPQLESGEFQQAHFKLDFEEFSETDKKLSGCMKGINLKRFKDDPTYSREIYCYNYFRDCGIWTSPRASYAHLFITITDYEEPEGTETSENSAETEASSAKTTGIKTLDYGIYAMIEEINKQFLAGRKSKDKAGDFTDNKGNLWKCTWANPGRADFADTNDNKFGIEKISLNESESERYTYDLKADKKKFDEAKTQLKAFITELNELSDSDTEAIKTFYESKMDADLFIKTYAINVILGMDDDYWQNSNNFYFYFDKGGKAYFIPYDYDNTLGTNCFDDTATKNPLEWGAVGEDSTAPLITKLLKVPEYMEKYKEYLLQYSDAESGFEASKSKERIQNWQEMISPYISSSDLYYGKSGTTSEFEDSVASWCSNYKSGTNYKLLSGSDSENYFKAKAASIKSWIENKTVTVTFDANGGTFTDYGGGTFSSFKAEINPNENLEDVFEEKVRYWSIDVPNVTFGGFAATADGTDPLDYVSSSCTVYAIWTPVYSVKISGEDSDVHFSYNSENSNNGLFNYAVGWLNGLSEGADLYSALENSSLFITKYGYKFEHFTDTDGNKVETFTKDLASGGITANFTELSSEEKSAVPYYIEKATDGSQESDKIVFTFKPEDFGMTSSDFSEVYLRGPKGWDNMILLSDSDNDGIWTNSIATDEEGFYEIRFKFYTDKNRWLGPKDTEYYSKNETFPKGYGESTKDPNFVINY